MKLLVSKGIGASRLQLRVGVRPEINLLVFRMTSFQTTASFLCTLNKKHEICKIPLTFRPFAAIIDTVERGVPR